MQPPWKFTSATASFARYPGRPSSRSNATPEFFRSAISSRRRALSVRQTIHSAAGPPTSRRPTESNGHHMQSCRRVFNRLTLAFSKTAMRDSAHGLGCARADAQLQGGGSDRGVRRIYITDLQRVRSNRRRFAPLTERIQVRGLRTRAERGPECGPQHPGVGDWRDCTARRLGCQPLRPVKCIRWGLGTIVYKSQSNQSESLPPANPPRRGRVLAPLQTGRPHSLNGRESDSGTASCGRSWDC